MKRFVLIVVAAYLFTLPAFGQTWQDRIRPLEQQPKEYRIHYDRFKDTTSVIGPNHPAADAKGKNHLSAGTQIAASFAGKEPDGDVLVVLIFTTVGSAIYDVPTLILLADQERMSFTDGTVRNDYRSGGSVLGGMARSSGRIMTTARVTYAITLEDLTQIAESESVEFQLGFREAYFSKKFMQNLRDFSDLFK